MSLFRKNRRSSNHDSRYDEMLGTFLADQAAQDAKKRLQRNIRVFISYSSHDIRYADEIAEHLREHQIEHFLDRKDLHAGEEIAERIAQEGHDCTHYILVLSQDSANSAWCAYEYGRADEMGLRNLVFLTQESVPLPPWARAKLQAYSIADLSDFLHLPPIEEPVVRRFIREVIRPPMSEDFDAKGFAAFTRVPALPESRADYRSDDRGCLSAWERPARHKVTRAWAKKPPPGVSSGGRMFLLPWEDELCRIEFVDNDAALPVILYCAAPGGRTVQYRLSYYDGTIYRAWEENHGAVLTTRRKYGSQELVIPHGENLFPGLPPQLRGGTRTWGWLASFEFWRSACKDMSERLAGQYE